MVHMLHALLICSEPECTETFEAYGTLEELEALACDCGCGLVVLELSEADGVDGSVELVPLR